MRCFVIIATKGRAKASYELLNHLAIQDQPPDFTILVGTEQADLAGLDEHPLLLSGKASAVISPRVGSSVQRNVGIEMVLKSPTMGRAEGRFFCAFFDDDFRMAKDWIKRAAQRLEIGDIVGLTGKILADGVNSGGISEQDAVAYLHGSRPPEAHWCSGEEEREPGSVYGCAMAFIDSVIGNVRFDEALPLYAWQEDRDYTGMARRLGRVIYYPGSAGVHLGISSGRVSGVRFGYSQVANLGYLMRKGTVSRSVGYKFILRSIFANLFRSIGRNPRTDYRGRLSGNLRALADAVKSGSFDPGRVRDLS